MEKFSLDRDWKFFNGEITLPETKSHTDCYMAAKAARRKQCGITRF